MHNMVESTRGRTGDLGEIFYFRTLRETLVHLKTEVSHCWRWLSIFGCPHKLNFSRFLNPTLQTPPARRQH